MVIENPIHSASGQCRILSLISIEPVQIFADSYSVIYTAQSAFHCLFLTDDSGFQTPPHSDFLFWSYSNLPWFLKCWPVIGHNTPDVAWSEYRKTITSHKPEITLLLMQSKILGFLAATSHWITELTVIQNNIQFKASAIPLPAGYGFPFKWSI